MSNEKFLYRKGNKVSLSNKNYATMYNRFLDRINSGLNRYPVELSIEHDKQKGPRPVVIVWSHRLSDKIIAVPLSKSNSEYNHVNHFVDSQGSYWKHEVLVLDKNKVHFINNHVWFHFPERDINDFFVWWKHSRDQISYRYIQHLISNYDNNVKDLIIKELLAKNYE